MMTYSRWTESNWYAYWSEESGDDVNEQIFVLWHNSSIKMEFDFTLASKVLKNNLLFSYFPHLPDSDIMQAHSYLNEFVCSVNEEYNGDKK